MECTKDKSYLISTRKRVTSDHRNSSPELSVSRSPRGVPELYFLDSESCEDDEESTTDEEVTLGSPGALSRSMEKALPTRRATLHYYNVRMWDKTTGKDHGTKQCVITPELIRCDGLGT